MLTSQGQKVASIALELGFQGYPAAENKKHGENWLPNDKVMFSIIL